MAKPNRIVWTDITTALAVESAFAKPFRARDPWSRRARGIFADVFIKADEVRYPLPVPDRRQKVGGNLPRLFEELQTQYRASLEALEVPRDDLAWLPIASDLQESAITFAAWVSETDRNGSHSNRQNVQKWVNFQFSEVNGTPRCAPKPGMLAREIRSALGPVLSDCVSRSGLLEQDDFLYAFDNIVRVPNYLSVMGENCAVLFHNLRRSAPKDTLARNSAGDAELHRAYGGYGFSRIFSDAPLSFEEYCHAIVRLRRDEARDILIYGTEGEQFERAKSLAEKHNLPERNRWLDVAIKFDSVKGLLAETVAWTVLSPGAVTAIGTIVDVVKYVADGSAIGKYKQDGRLARFAHSYRSVTDKFGNFLTYHVRAPKLINLVTDDTIARRLGNYPEIEKSDLT